MARARMNARVTASTTEGGARRLKAAFPRRLRPPIVCYRRFRERSGNRVRRLSPDGSRRTEAQAMSASAVAAQAFASSFRLWPLSAARTARKPAASTTAIAAASQKKPCRHASFDQFLPGDLLFFLGDDELSRAIAWKTSTWSQWLFGLTFGHVEICADGRFNGNVGVYAYGSTTLCDLPCLHAGKCISGVQVHAPQTRVDQYPGKVWRLRLTESLNSEERGRLWSMLYHELGKPYDAERAALLAGRRFVYDFHGLAPTPGSRFCSELASAALKHVNRVVPRGADPESYSPNSLALAALHSGEAWPIGEKSQSRRLK